MANPHLEIVGLRLRYMYAEYIAIKVAAAETKRKTGRAQI
jgi:hypothetical protein